MDKVTIILADDWQGIYVNNQILWQHHDIEEYGWVRLHNAFLVPWEEVSLNREGIEWLCEEGSLPDEFTDIPEEYISK